MHRLSLRGVDVMGERLAEEVSIFLCNLLLLLFLYTASIESYFIY